MKRSAVLLLSLFAFPVLGQSMPQSPTAATPPVAPPLALPPLPPGGSVPLPVIPDVPLGSTKTVELQSVPLTQVIALYYQNNSRQYVLSPELISDNSLVSFRFDGNIDAKFFSLLSQRGYTVSSRGGVDYISITQVAPPDSKPFIYFPKHRDPVDLSRSLQPFFKGTFGSLGQVSTSVPNQNASSSTSASGVLDRSQDYLTFFGPESEHEQLKELLKTLDRPVPSVEIRAVLYEVSMTDSKGSSLNIVGETLKGINFSLNTGGTPLQDSASVSVGAGGFNLVYSSLNRDSRFTVLSSPVLRVVSGKSASLTVGQEVPVLGSVSYTDGSSTPVQSVEYRQSGSLFTVTPKVYKDSVEVSINQELSEFASTTASKIDSPTLLRRSVTGTLTLRPNEVVFIGGIDTDKATSANGKFLFFKNKQRSKTTSQLVLMLQAIPILAPGD